MLRYGYWAKVAGQEHGGSEAKEDQLKYEYRVWVREQEHDKTKAKRERQLKHNCRAKVAAQKRDNGQAGKVDHLKHVCRMVAMDLERGESQATKKVIHVLLGDASRASAVRRLTCGCGPFADTTGRAGVVAVLIRRSSWLALRDHFRGKAGVLQTPVRRWPRR